MFSQAASQAIADEIARGFAARQAQNEGRARVCARRAAGAAAREYLRLSGQPTLGSAYELLGVLQGSEHISLRVKEAARLLRLKVDEEYNLPAGIDLLDQAQILAQELERLV